MTTINLMRYPEEDMEIITAGGTITKNKTKEVDFETELEDEQGREQ